MTRDEILHEIERCENEMKILDALKFYVRCVEDIEQEIQRIKYPEIMRGEKNRLELFKRTIRILLIKYRRIKNDDQKDIVNVRKKISSIRNELYLIQKHLEEPKYNPCHDNVDEMKDGSLESVIKYTCNRVGLGIDKIIDEGRRGGAKVSESRRLISCIIMEDFWNLKDPIPLSVFSKKIGLDQSSVRAAFKTKYLLEGIYLDVYNEIKGELITKTKINKSDGK